MEAIIFHAKRHKDDVNPNHTLAFQKHSDGTIHCTYAKPHNNLDSYSKKFGRSLAIARLGDMNTKLEKQKIARKANFLSSRQIKRYVPNTVITNMHYYLDKAKKILKIDEDMPIILRGQFADWNRYESEELKTVPTFAVALIINPFVITPKKKV